MCEARKNNQFYSSLTRTSLQISLEKILCLLPTRKFDVHWHSKDWPVLMLSYIGDSVWCFLKCCVANRYDIIIPYRRLRNRYRRKKEGYSPHYSELVLLIRKQIFFCFSQAFIRDSWFCSFLWPAFSLCHYIHLFFVIPIDKVNSHFNSFLGLRMVTAGFGLFQFPLTLKCFLSLTLPSSICCHTCAVYICIM